MQCIMLLFAILSTLLCENNASGFDYPAEMPPPKEAHYAVLFPIADPISQFETPIAIRFTSIIDTVGWNCVAVYHSTFLDAITKQRPIVTANDDTINHYGNSNTRLLCLAYASAMVGIDYFTNIPGYTDTIKATLSSYGLDDSYVAVDSEVTNCDVHDVVCLHDVAETNNFVPEIMASIVAYQAIHFLHNDGWNQDGYVSSDGGFCTANCRAYGDTTGYKPNYNQKNRWVPLVEDNGKGFFYHYSHVTPHIGKTAVTRTITREELESHCAPKPKYKYKIEKQLVIERLADLAVNDTQKMLVEFFDNKINVAVTMLFSMDALLQWSLEERLHFMVAYTATEYDAVVQAWREKVRYDLIRPTTLIKNDGKKKITTFGGPYKGLQEIESEDFESYHRVMPHSEYPSASGCLCLAATEYADLLLKNRYGIDDSLSIQVPFPAGSSLIEPGVTPMNDLLITFKDLTEYSDTCSESRLWGGMHFTTSISGAKTLCATLGQTGYEFAEELLDGTSF